MKEPFRLEDLVVNPGEKGNGYVHVVGADFGLPVTVICGVEEGETLLISGGIHNAEYVGVQSAMAIAEQLDPQKIRGNVIIIRLCNVTGFEHRTMSLVYEDGKNLNRVFPGNASGTLADRIAYTMETKFFNKADYYIDLHSGDGFESLESYVYCLGNASDYVVEKSRAMADIAHVPYLVISQSNSGGAYNYAGSLGIPAILLERGSNSTWCQSQVNEDVHDVKNIMRLLGILMGKHHTPAAPVVVDPVIYDDAPVSGCWYPQKQAGETFHQGDVLGYIKDYFGEVLYTHHAKMDGIILYETISLCIMKDSPMVCYGAWNFAEHGDITKDCDVCGTDHQHQHHHHSHE